MCREKAYLNVGFQVVSHRVDLFELVPVLLQTLFGLRLEILLRGEVVGDHLLHASPVLQLLLQAVVVLGQEAEGMINLRIMDGLLVYYCTSRWPMKAYTDLEESLCTPLKAMHKVHGLSSASVQGKQSHCRPWLGCFTVLFRQ